MKKVLSTVLVAALVMGSFATAFAADTTSGASDATPTSTKTTTKASSTTKVVATGDKYVVKPGDTIAKIATAYNVTVDQLVKNNNIKNKNLISVGQVLYINAGTATATTTPAAPATTTTTPAAPTAPVVVKSEHAATTPADQGIYEDVVSTASVNLTKEADLAKSLGANGTWITTIANNVVCTNDLLWTGDVRKEATAPATQGALGRKLGVYYHSTPNIGPEQIFTLKVPNLVVKAGNANLAYGTLDGNVKVDANGFNMTYCTITGNLEFATQAQYDSAKFNDVVIKGKVIVAGVEKSSKDKPQTIVNYAKYDASAAKSDMIRAAVTFKDAKAYDVYFDVMGADYYIKEGVLSSGNQGNWLKVAYNKALQYGIPGANGAMIAPSADRPADSILRWDQQMTNLQNLYKKSGYDMSKIPTCERDASHPSVIDFNKYDGGKYKAFTVSATNGAIDATKLKGADRSAAAKADVVTSVSVDVGKYLKAAQAVVDAGTK